MTKDNLRRIIAVLAEFMEVKYGFDIHAHDDAVSVRQTLYRFMQQIALATRDDSGLTIQDLDKRVVEMARELYVGSFALSDKPPPVAPKPKPADPEVEVPDPPEEFHRKLQLLTEAREAAILVLDKKEAAGPDDDKSTNIVLGFRGAVRPRNIELLPSAPGKRDEVSIMLTW
jgi:hypothetical protein